MGLPASPPRAAGLAARPALEMKAPGPPAALRFTLVLDPGEPLSGTLTLAETQSEVRFAGWVELMAAVNAARVKPPSPPAPGAGDATGG